jgi:hypothetical protein
VECPTQGRAVGVGEGVDLSVEDIADAHHGDAPPQPARTRLNVVTITRRF